MATNLPLLLFLLLITFSIVQPQSLNSPYLSSKILFPNYNKMLNNFKIYLYSPPIPFNFTSPSESIFHSSLLQSSFITQNADDANLFFLPFPSAFSKRSLSRHIAYLRTSFPYWNRALGADHFFLSTSGIGYASDRNVVELKKNSIQISCFPAASGMFIPHKDITLPPVNPSPLSLPLSAGNLTTTILGYMKLNGEAKSKSRIVNELSEDPEFVVELEPLDDLKNSKYCLFEYGGDLSWIGEAMASGCVPAVITDRPIQDLPLMDVLRWSEIAVFVGTEGGVEGLKGVLGGISEDKYERMKGLCVTASQHFVWNASPQPLDAFHMVMYQLWLRRHTIRYTRREWT